MAGRVIDIHDSPDNNRLHFPAIPLWIYGLGIIFVPFYLLYFRLCTYIRSAVHECYPEGLVDALDSKYRLHNILLLSGGWGAGMGLVNLTRHTVVLYILDCLGYQQLVLDIGHDENWDALPG